MAAIMKKIIANTIAMNIPKANAKTAIIAKRLFMGIPPNLRED